MQFLTNPTVLSSQSQEGSTLVPNSQSQGESKRQKGP